MCVCKCCIHVTVHKWNPQDNFPELVLSFCLGFKASFLLFMTREVLQASRLMSPWSVLPWLPSTFLLDYGITPPHPTFHVGSRDWTLVIRDERQGAFVHNHLSDFMCPAPNMGVRDPRACLAKAYRLSHHPETGDFKGVRLYRISANRN